MFRKIVVPVDGSGFGELALPIALGIAGKSGGAVRVVTVVIPLADPHPTEDGNALEAERLLVARKHAGDYQGGLLERVVQSGSGVPISAHVEEGPVVEKLDEHVRGAGADLLVMTTHGRGPLSRAWLGSVADGLIRSTPCPILAVRPGEDQALEFAQARFEHLLVTLDGSPESREILPFAREVARAFEARMTLLRVVSPHFSLSSSFISHTAHEDRGLAEERDAALAALEVEAAELRTDGFRVEVETVTAPHPQEGILAFATEEEVDLIAMATHGRGGVTRLFLGSVADKVIRGGTIPVLLHRAS